MAGVVRCAAAFIGERAPAGPQPFRTWLLRVAASPKLHVRAQKCDLVRQRDLPKSSSQRGGKASAKIRAFWGEARSRQCPKLNLLCEKTVGVRWEHGTFLSAEVMARCRTGPAAVLVCVT